METIQDLLDNLVYRFNHNHHQLMKLIRRTALVVNDSLSRLDFHFVFIYVKQRQPRFITYIIFFFLAL